MTLKPEEVARLCAKFGITRKAAPSESQINNLERHKSNRMSPMRLEDRIAASADKSPHQKRGRRMRRIADAGKLTWKDE